TSAMINFPTAGPLLGVAIGRVDAGQDHALSEGVLVLVGQRRVGRVAVLDRPGGPGLDGSGESRAVLGQVAERPAVTGLARQGARVAERHIGEMEATLRAVLPRAGGVAARNGPDAARLVRGVVEVEDRRADPVVLVREERMILVQWERRAVLRRLDEQLGVV